MPTMSVGLSSGICGMRAINPCIEFSSISFIFFRDAQCSLHILTLRGIVPWIWLNGKYNTVVQASTVILDLRPMTDIYAWT
jgi:hypothetical protein